MKGKAGKKSKAKTKCIKNLEEFYLDIFCYLIMRKLVSVSGMFVKKPLSAASKMDVDFIKKIKAILNKND